MSKIFKMIKRNIDVSKISKLIKDNPNDWCEVRKIKDVTGNYMGSDFLPLTIGVTNENTNIIDSNLKQNTHLYSKYMDMINLIKDLGFHEHDRCAFFRLKPNHCIGVHNEVGDYYLDKDRWHLSISGIYEYRVGNEVHIIEPGDFFWFDNKQWHDAKNISDTEDRVSFVWDSKKDMTDYIKDIDVANEIYKRI